MGNSYDDHGAAEDALAAALAAAEKERDAAIDAFDKFDAADALLRGEEPDLGEPASPVSCPRCGWEWGAVGDEEPATQTSDWCPECPGPASECKPADAGEVSDAE